MNAATRQVLNQIFIAVGAVVVVVTILLFALPAHARARVITCNRFGCSDRVQIFQNKSRHVIRRNSRRGHVTQRRIARLDANGNAAQIVAHPAGCPWRRFCGCGVSVKVFGHPVRSLYLAANWPRRFPRTAPAAGMVAARSGHVMYIMAYLGNGMAKVYDPNSGHHQTRIHVRSLRGYVVVNPYAGARTYHARQRNWRHFARR